MLTEELHDKGYSECDKCKCIRLSDDLIWITAEDFQPKEGEKLSEQSKRYDALCELCYQSLLIK